MSKALVVIVAAVRDVLDHRVAATPTATQQIPFAKGFQQRFGLVQPGRIGRRVHHMYARGQCAQEGFGLGTGVTRTIVDDAVNAPGPTVGMPQPTEGWPEMFAIILVQTFSRHMSVIDDQASQQIDGTMSDILERLMFELAAAHRFRRLRSLQRLQIGLLIRTDDDLTALPQTLNPLVIPEDFQRAFDRFIIPDRRLPVAKTMRLQLRNILKRFILIWTFQECIPAI